MIAPYFVSVLSAVVAQAGEGAEPAAADPAMPAADVAGGGAEEAVPTQATTAPVSLRFGGYADFEAEWNKKNERRIDFDQHHFALYVTGTVLDHVSAFAELEWEHGVEFGDGDGTGDMKAERAWVEGFLHESFNVRAGKTLTPFGYWAERHDPTQRETTLRPLVHDSGPFPKVLTGVMAYGVFFLGDLPLAYDLGAFNGPGAENPHEKDNNGDKTLAGKLKLTLPGFHTTLIASGYRALAEGKRNTAADFVLEVEQPWVRLTLEGAVATVDPVHEGDTVNQQAGYAEIVVKPAEGVGLLARYDYNDKDLDETSSSGSQGTRYVVGVSYRPIVFTVLKLEYAHHMPEEGDVSEQVIASVAASF